jgi:hypothetical protein
LLRGEYLLRGQGRGEVQEKDAQGETAEPSRPRETFVFPVLIPHLETPVRLFFLRRMLTPLGQRIIAMLVK